MGKGVSKNPKNMPTSFMYGPYIVPVLIVGKSFPSFLNGWLYLNFQVVTLCAMLWSLPRIWVYYGTYIFPYWSSFLLPMVQISIMSSVYCTIVMSWERYVRICLGVCIWRSDILLKIFGCRTTKIATSNNWNCIICKRPGTILSMQNVDGIQIA